ncbi:BPSS1187 family protein [Stieleria marina]
MKTLAILFTILCGGTVYAQLAPNDSAAKQYRIKMRASDCDSRVQSHPEIGFVLEDKKGKPADFQNASVDTRVKSQGKLVIWLMGHNQPLFDRLNSYGLHAIQVHYANKWFSICCRENPVGETCRGDIRLEAATGKDFSDEVDIPGPDGMMQRALHFVKALDAKHPLGKWGQFLNEDHSDLDWSKVIVSGSSHGSTTAARFAKHQKVSRVVALCGPRDQLQTWQSLPSATPENRYFGFSHVLDGGWTDDHYCRSWELLGLNKFGPIVNVDKSQPPYQNTRRLITDFDVDGDAKRAHSSVQPGSRAKKNADGTFGHEDVWRYLYTHPVDQVGEAVPMDDSCNKNQRGS